MARITSSNTASINILLQRIVLRTVIVPSPRRLEDKGFVTSKMGEPTPERGGRAKKYFHITAKGLRQVREAKQALTKLWKGLPELSGGAA